jgi:ribosomal protein L11 methyltransferase
MAYVRCPMSEPPRYPYVAVDVTPEEADEASAVLFELGAQGVEERDATTLVRGAAGKVTLVGSFDDEGDASAAIAAIAELSATWSPRLEQVVGDAWRDEWKKHFEPFRICRGVVVRPPWRPYAAAPGEHVIELEPGRAFGTGLHETTRLVAEILADRGTALRGSRVLDVGCGSGVLSLVALALGAETVRAIDVDPDAVAVTRENAERNGLSSRVVADETPVGAVDGRYDTVLANIEARTLVELAPGLIGRVAPGGLLVLSGILTAAAAPAQIEDIKRAFEVFELIGVRPMGEWVAMSWVAPLEVPARNREQANDSAEGTPSNGKVASRNREQANDSAERTPSNGEVPARNREQANGSAEGRATSHRVPRSAE